MTGAIVMRAFGGPDVLVMEDRELGQPGPGEVRLKQTAVGVNFIDVYHRTGFYPNELPLVPGSEAAGEVVAVGAGVSDLKVGDRVAYQGAIGAYAEERLIAADRLVRLPDGVSDETAAASLLKGLTAHYLLFDTWPIKAGDTMLVHAAAGGVGQILVQWGKALGARVLATAGSPEKVEIVRALGCDEVIDYRRESFAEWAKERTGGKGVDVVYDGVGKDTFEGSLNSLRPRGLLASFGSASGGVSIANLGVLASKGSLYVTRPTLAHYYPRAEDLRAGASALFGAMLSGAVKLDVAQRLPLAQAADAHRALEGRQTTGQTVLLP